MAHRDDAAKRLAEKYGAIYVPMWEALKEAQETIAAEDLTEDYVHLTARGNFVVAQAWLQVVETYIHEKWM